MFARDMKKSLNQLEKTCVTICHILTYFHAFYKKCATYVNQSLSHIHFFFSFLQKTKTTTPHTNSIQIYLFVYSIPLFIWQLFYISLFSIFVYLFFFSKCQWNIYIYIYTTLFCWCYFDWQHERNKNKANICMHIYSKTLKFDAKSWIMRVPISTECEKRSTRLQCSTVIYVNHTMCDKGKEQWQQWWWQQQQQKQFKFRVMYGPWIEYTKQWSMDWEPTTFKVSRIHWCLCG